MGRVEQVIDWLSRGLGIVAAVCVVLMMVHVCADVAAKYLFNRPIEGTLEIVSRYYMVAVVFLPLALVEMRREHIRVDLIVRLLPDWLYAPVYFVGCVLVAGFYSLLAYQGYIAAMRSTAINEVMMGTSFVVIWPGKWFLPIGFGVVALAVVLHGVQAILHPNRFAFDPPSEV